MLNENKADSELEKAMEMVSDELLKAKTPEEKEKAAEKFQALHRIYNERLKIQNDDLVQRGKSELDSEKFDHDKARQEEEDVENKKARRREFWSKIGIKAVELGIVATGVVIQCIMIHNNTIETDAISKGTTRTIIGKFGDYLKG